VKEIIVRLCDCNKPEFDEQTIRVLVAVLSGVDSKYVTVTYLGLADDNRCCKRYKITITAEKSDSTVNVDTATNQVASALSGSGFAVETVDTTSSAATIVASVFFAVLAFFF
jgi:hypothetical protein